MLCRNVLVVDEEAIYGRLMQHAPNPKRRRFGCDGVDSDISFVSGLAVRTEGSSSVECGSPTGSYASQAINVSTSNL